MSLRITRSRDKVLSDDPLIRATSCQSVLSAFAEGTFLTGSAVFAQIVGLSAAQVDLGLTIAGVGVHPSARAAERYLARRQPVAA